MAVELAAALLLATAISDALGFAGASFYLLVAGVPLTAAAGLICFACVVDAVNEGRMDSLGRLQATLSALLVAAVVIGAAIREPSVASGDVPPVGHGGPSVRFRSARGAGADRPRPDPAQAPEERRRGPAVPFP